MRISNTTEPLHAENANLSGSTFSDVNLEGAAFSDVKLTGTRIENACLGGVRIRDASLKGLAIEDCDLTDMTMGGLGFGGGAAMTITGTITECKINCDQ